MAAVAVVAAASEEVLAEAVAVAVVVADKNEFHKIIARPASFLGCRSFVLMRTMCKKLKDNLARKVKSPIFVPSFKTNLL